MQRFGRLRRSGDVDVDDGVKVCRSSVYGVDAGVGAALGLPGSPQKRRLFLFEAFSGCGKRGTMSLPVGAGLWSASESIC